MATAVKARHARWLRALAGYGKNAGDRALGEEIEAEYACLPPETVVEMAGFGLS